MISFFQSFLGTGYKGKVIQLNDKIRILCETQTKDVWHFSYFFVGSYGNYLFGLPLNPKNFNELMTSLGGVKFCYPWALEENRYEDHKYIFTRFGAITLWQEEEVSEFPVKKVEGVPHTDLNVSYQERGEHYLLAVKFYESSFIMSSSLGVFNSSFIHPFSALDHFSHYSVLPSWGQGNFSSLVQLIEKNETKLHKMETLPEQWPYKIKLKSSADKNEEIKSMTSFVEALKEDRFIFHWDKQSMSLAMYDDFEFEHNDIEMIPPLARKQLDEFFKKNGFEKKPGDSYVSEDSSQSIYFSYAPTPYSNMSSLTDFHKIMATDTIKLITPTQMAALILESTVEKESRFRSLTQKIPINMKKIEPMIKKIFSKDQTSTIMAKTKQHQKKCIQFYRDQKPKGIKGSIYEK